MAKRNYKKDDVVEVIWDDAATTHGWHSRNIKNLKDNDGLVRCRTVGYFIRSNKRAIQITQGLGDDDLKDTQSIPMSTVKKTRRLK